MKLTLLAFFCLTAVALGQRCTCHKDGSRGFWEELTNCQTCDTDFTDKLPADECKGFTYCGNPATPTHLRQCYGAGTCNEATKKCDCTGANVAGDYCERCTNGWVGWPSCTTAVCDDSVTCNGHGSCSDAAASKACGVRRAGASYLSVSFDPTTEQCVTDYDALTRETTHRTFQIEDQETKCGIPGLPTSNTANARCTYFQECMSQDLGLCCNKGYEVCISSDGTSGQCCHPSGTCCDGVCCSSTQACVDDNTSPYAPLDWVMEDGTTMEVPQVCINSYMSGPAATRVVVLPLFLLLGVLISAGMIFASTGLSPIGMAVPTLLIVLCSIFLIFSSYWPYALVLCLSGFFAMGAAKAEGKALVYALVVEVVALAVVCGGLGLGAVWVNSQGAFPALDGGGAGSRSSNWQQLINCRNYYDYFDSVNKAWDEDPTIQYWGYCSHGWFSMLYFSFALAVFAKILLIVSTGTAYLGGK